MFSMPGHSWKRTEPGAEKDVLGRFSWKCPSCGEECLSKDIPDADGGFVTVTDDVTLGWEHPFVDYLSGWGEDRIPADCGTALVQRTMST